MTQKELNEIIKRLNRVRSQSVESLLSESDQSNEENLTLESIRVLIKKGCILKAIWMFFWIHGAIKLGHLRWSKTSW